jgi:uncharacterized protein YfbU (UPF0304 family)
MNPNTPQRFLDSLSQEELDYVRDVLNMHALMGNVRKDAQTEFQGFSDTRLADYCEWLRSGENVSGGGYTYLIFRSNYSASGTRARYEPMLREWNSSHERTALTRKDVERILNAAP